MKQLGRLLRPVWAAVLFAASVSGLAQGPAARLTGAIAGNARTVLPNSRNPRALPANDMGALSPDTAVNGITLVFSRSAAQETALQALAAAQGNSASPLYHQWLTPETFAAQFGVADSDISAVQAWLQSQGFTLNGVGRSRDRITFSGTAGQVTAAFGTELHHFKVDSVLHFAPASDLSLPSALAPLVSSVQHLSDFRPKPAIRYPSAQPAYTSSQSNPQNHFLTPADIATMYDIKPEYNAGYNGMGQNIAVAGQSYINTQDVQRFQSAAGLPVNLPNLVLVPNSGTSATLQLLGDEGESDLDTEYTSGIAPGAGIDLVYTGDSPNHDVFDAVTYAVTEDIAPIVTLSYGDCELNRSTADLNSYNAVAEQATVQGQTLITASGDNGSTTCHGDTDLSTAQQETPSVDFPASSPYYTGIGGTQMIAGASTPGSTTYWAAANGSDNISSLLSYVPEVVWNEDAPPTASSTGGLSSGGGGASVVFARPSWQTGVPGIPAGPYRLVPDIALQASTGTPGYLYCSSDPNSFQPSQTSSCTNGFRDTATGLLTVAGGTSFGAPIFAGLVAILNQATHAAGQGNINVTLYGLASNPTTYASAFHDITSGTNACTAGATFCSAAGASEYAAGAGYDEATGLGSIDFAKLVAAWPATAQSVKTASSIFISLANNNPAAGTTEQVTINVGGGSASPVSPTGTVNVLLDGTVIASALPLSSTGSVTTSFTAPASTGSHVIAAAYSGDSTHASSTGSVTFNIGSLTPIGAFTLSAGPITVAANSTGSSTIMVIPSSGYVGTVNFTVTSALPANICYGINPVDVDAPPPTGTLTFGTGAACSGAAVRLGTPGSQAITSKGGHAAVASAPPKPGHEPSHGKEIATALAGLLAIGFFTRRRPRLPSLLALGALSLMVSLGLGGCGSSTAPVTPPGGTTSPASYTVTLVGTDSVTAAITSSTTFTLTVN